jgi:hypothetical protein
MNVCWQADSWKSWIILSTFSRIYYGVPGHRSWAVKVIVSGNEDTSDCEVLEQDVVLKDEGPE